MASTAPATASENTSDKITKVDGKAPVAYDAGDYIVMMKQPGAASYAGGTNGLAATRSTSGRFDARSSAVASYTSYLKRSNRQVASAVGATIDSQFTIASNGFSAHLTGKQATELAKDKDVLAVVENDRRELLDYDSDNTANFLDMVGKGGSWASNGGRSKAGAGVVVGVLDTGIWPESKSFKGAALSSRPTGAWDATMSPIGVTSMKKADGTTFTGECETGEDFELSDCSSKIIGARYYDDSFLAYVDAGYIVPNDGEVDSARDGDSHGSHTASTAAGRPVNDVVTEGVEFGQVVGMAPQASVAAYKVCWEATTPDGDDASGCYTDAILSAIDDAVRDGVDVINYSIGGSPSEDYDVTDVAFAGAADAGVFVAASAGNSGPTASSVDNQGPWLTSVAASTYRNFDGTVVLGDGTTMLGATSSSSGVPEQTALVDSDPSSTDLDSPSDAKLCAPDSLDSADVEGKIVVCLRGVQARVDKSAEVARAGGIGMILVNPSEQGLVSDFHSVPTIHLESDYAEAIYAYVDYAAEPTAALLPGNESDEPSAAVPVIAGFSSRGPGISNDMDILNPDIAAPGVDVLAAVAPSVDSGRNYDLESGTSMASPHIAGLGAFILSRHPNWTPQQVQSAMMTTATSTRKANGNVDKDVFASGAGEVTPTSMFDPGLFVASTAKQWYGLLAWDGWDTGVKAIDPKKVNIPSMADGSVLETTTFTRTFTLAKSGTWTPHASVPGFDVTFSKARISGAKGQKRTLKITFTPDADASYGKWAKGYVTLRGTTRVRMPVALRPQKIVAPAEVTAEGTDGSVDVTVTGGTSEDVPLTMEGLAGADVVSGEVDPSDYQLYCVDADDASSLLRFDLDAEDDTADLDLYVYSFTEAGCDGDYAEVGSSATGSADESVTVESPDSPSYMVEVDGYSAGELGSPMAFDLKVYDVSPAASAGDVTFTPDTLSLEPRQDTTFTTSWTGLDADAEYLGYIHYGDTGVTTLLRVTTPAAG
ncbi:S8 family serine peptidase [Nocardioides sp. GY 10127]|uniref:S8 family serine peptidase n=1 Tax=Nocardioides sp. GY 10127 TaxID=2569762 RepID=UPI0010A7E252|nr:S8 family serine peptidase [Nocardioides sp. GY 10127]TIC82869.1 S8 family peptidase [Nocardioides sp. GY 10127]